MELAQNDVVKARVEKASICAYRAAMEEAWEWTIRNRKNLDELEMPQDIAQRTRPYARRLFELIEKYNVTQWSLGTPTLWAKETPPAKAIDILRRGYGLKEDEAF